MMISDVQISKMSKMRFAIWISILHLANIPSSAHQWWRRHEIAKANARRDAFTEAMEVLLDRSLPYQEIVLNKRTGRATITSFEPAFRDPSEAMEMMRQLAIDAAMEAEGS